MKLQETTTQIFAKALPKDTAILTAGQGPSTTSQTLETSAGIHVLTQDSATTHTHSALIAQAR